MPISKKKEIKGKGKAAKKQPDPLFPKILQTDSETPTKSILIKNSRIKKPLTKKQLKGKKHIQDLSKKVKFNLDANSSTTVESPTEDISQPDYDNDEPVINIKMTETFAGQPKLKIKIKKQKKIVDSQTLSKTISTEIVDNNLEQSQLDQDIEMEESKIKLQEIEGISTINSLNKTVILDASQYEDEEEESENTEIVKEVRVIEMNMIDLNDIKNKIDDVINVLGNFKRLKDQIHKPRKFFFILLIHLLSKLYGYNRWLMTKFVTLIPLQELIEFLDWNERERPLTLRTNTLKISPSDLLSLLKKKRGGVLKCDRLNIFDNNQTSEPNEKPNLTPKRKSDMIIVYESQFSLGATPEYLGGLYTIQGAASYLASITLDPQPDEKILDLCAAPGGKSCHIAALMKNRGVLFSNDVNYDRAKSISSNYHRLGISNIIVTSYDGREYPKIMLGFNRALVDAPCMGTGVISKDPTVKINKDEKSLRKCTRMQRELLLAAIDCVDPKSAGIIVYSTCSLLVDENELVIDYVLKKRNVKIIPTGHDIGNPGFSKFREHRFHPDMKYCKRFYPHIHNTDGFFIAKLKKIYKKPIAEDGDLITVPVKTSSKKNKIIKKNGQKSKKERSLIKKKSKIIKGRPNKFRLKKRRPLLKSQKHA